MSYIKHYSIIVTGSKEELDLAREKFIKYLKTTECDYVEVLFGGDDSSTNIAN